MDFRKKLQSKYAMLLNEVKNAEEIWNKFELKIQIKYDSCAKLKMQRKYPIFVSQKIERKYAIFARLKNAKKICNIWELKKCKDNM